MEGGGSDDGGDCPLTAARKKRRHVALEGAPVLGVFGVLEW